MELDFRHLRLIRAVANGGSLAAAAAAVGMAQPSAAAALGRAERIVGGRLFRRTADGLVATELGEVVTAHALTILGALEQFEECAGQDGRPTVRIGATPGPLAAALPRIIDLVLDVTSDVRIGFNGRRWLTMVAARHLDAALVVDYPAAELTSPHTIRRVVAVEPLFVALPERHPLGDRVEVDLRELADATLGEMSDAGPSAHEHLVAACAEAGFTPATVTLGLAELRSFARRRHAALLLRPTSQPPPGMVAVPLAGTPLRMTTSLHVGADHPLIAERGARLWSELVAAQHRVVDTSRVYRAWRERHPDWRLTPGAPRPRGTAAP
ncbi:LysR family transcriptional regulator [Pilimelia anulata]|uniref:LysR family transcriptional regulator n=1 Tax=Pilimelia anulata TaxID=53371 RepID=UPI00166957C5|nr:LysR family transcriptional regulator [Pilimelia anulata]